MGESVIRVSLTLRSNSNLGQRLVLPETDHKPHPWHTPRIVDRHLTLPERAGQSDHFIVARLASPADGDTPPVTIEIDGQILLNSRADSTPTTDGAVQLQAYQAIVGTGRVHFVSE
jgi:hypothetical protein